MRRAFSHVLIPIRFGETLMTNPTPPVKVCSGPGPRNAESIIDDLGSQKPHSVLILLRAPGQSDNGKGYGYSKM